MMLRSLLLVAVLGTVSHADTFDDGLALYKAGKYTDAIAKFQEGLAIANDPVYLFNIAQSYRKLFDCVAASDYYHRYLDADRDADAKQKALVAQWLAELQPCVDQRTAEVAKAKAEAPKPLPVLVIRQPPPRPTAPRTIDVDRGRPFRIAGIALGATGIVALGAGAYFAKHGATLRDRLAADCAERCDWDVEGATAAEGERANRDATWALIGGGIVGIAGASLYVFGTLRVEHLEIAPAAGGGATVGLHARW